MTVAILRARVCGIGLIAPGIEDWQAGAAILDGRRCWETAPLTMQAAAFLPAAERRRAGKVVRLALACAHQAVAASGFAAGEIASVFASTDGDAQNTHEICTTLNEAEPSLSPTRFHNSVQNAVSGYWTILTRSRAPTVMVMGGDEILALGLLEAMSQAVQSKRPVLVVVFDMVMPAPLFAAHPIEGGGAIALVLSADDNAGPGLVVRLSRRGSAQSNAEARASAESRAARGLPEELRRVHPIGPALPMLVHLATQTSGRSSLAFDRYHSLEISINCND
jgi:hypothetical protein